ncbi:hypothetical protein M405DRAFT_695724, partial [Rhizopogon salebrosus TDB-379]
SSAPDIITYRLNNKMMYVPPAQNYDQAVIFARSAFERDLNGVDNSRISFWLNVLANGKQTSVSIVPAAWPSVVSRLARSEIIDVHIHPAIEVSPPPSSLSSSSSEVTEREQHPTSPPPPSSLQ